MASRTEQKERARREREEREEAAEAKARRDRRLRLVGATLAAAVIVVIVAIVVSSSSSSKKHPAKPPAIGGLTQTGLTIGDPKAPVTIHEFADLQCPVCDDFDLNVLPQVQQNYVRTGKAKIVYENFPILGQDSVTAAYAAAAAGIQNKGWSFIDRWYRNQGPENSGYVTPAFIQKIASGVPGLNVSKLMTDRDSAPVKAIVRASASKGNSLGFNGTPSFVFVGPHGKQQAVNGQELTYSQVSSLVNTLLTSG